MQQSDFNFSYPFRVRYAEVDAQAVVFNAHYLTYFDTAIMEYFRWLGYDYTSEVKATGLDFHVVRSVIEYKAPILFDEEIDVAVRVDRIGQSSLRFVLAIFGGVFYSLRATGEIVYVYTDQATHEATRIGDDFRALIASKDPPAP